MKEKRRCKNFFALGMLYWLYSRDFDTTINVARAKKFAKQAAATSAPTCSR